MTKKAHCQACSNLTHGVKTRKSIPHTYAEGTEKKVMELMKTKNIIESGYAGILSNGHIVDRRENPDAIPIPENPLFNTPAPKSI